MIRKDVIIIGAGASGIMCAIESGKRGRSVLVLDHSDKIGKKIRLSGGGNCNFTNLNVSHRNYLSNNTHFCKSALSRFTPRDIINLLEKHGVEYEERDGSQLFCAGSSEDLIKILQKEISFAGIDMILNCRILGVEKEDSFIVSTDHGIFESESLVIATGGLSYPGSGASGIGYDIAKQFGIKVTELRPALVPFIFSRKDRKAYEELSGVSIVANVKCRKMEFKDSILFTHTGLSGPAILRVSLYWREGDAIIIDLLPGIDIYGIFITRQQSKSRTEMHNLLSEYMPARLSKVWCALNILIKPVNQYTDKELRNIAQQSHNWVVMPDSTGDFRTAEITLGGIDTDELSSKTMGSKKVKGLYFTGEVVDVTGQLGGYNLQWAWASGFAAGQYV